MIGKFTSAGAAVMFGVALLGAVVAFGLMANSTLTLAGGCSPGCGDQGASADGGTQVAANQHSGHGQHGAPAATASERTPAKELMQPVPSVLENYARIESALANDSLNGVPEAARAISKLVTGDEMKMLPAEVATQANALASAKDLTAAREAFKPFSASLTQYLQREKVQTGRYYEAYCPMAKANWLQTDKAIKNPYYGKSMLTCGEIRKVY